MQQQIDLIEKFFQQPSGQWGGINHYVPEDLFRKTEQSLYGHLRQVFLFLKNSTIPLER
jgi:hypothetical protein